MKAIKKAVSIAVLAAILPLSSYSLAEEHKKNIFIESPQKHLQETKKVDAPLGGKNNKFIPNPEFYIALSGPSEQYKTKLGSTLQGILTGECDFVEYYLRDFGEGKDLVITCYEKEDDKYRAEWALNWDNVCRAYAKENDFLGIKTTAYFVAELSRGEVSSKKMSHKAAKELTSKVSDYLKNNNNRCKSWQNFVQQEFGPRGPIQK